MAERMTEERAKALMDAGVIENYAVNPDGSVTVKRSMTEKPGPSWDRGREEK